MSADVPAHSIVVGVFERDDAARHAVDAVRALGFDDGQLAIVASGEVVANSGAANPSGLLARGASATEIGGTSVASILGSLGVPDGEARFYASEADAGRTLAVIDANTQFEAVRQLVLNHGGYDVQSRGAALIRGGGDAAGVSGGVGARPIDVTANWPDFASRYQMLWQQHYGTTDATWEQMEPVYRYAWQLANAPEYRGRPWAGVEGAVRRAWEGSEVARQCPWSQAEGAVRDVWEDVAEEAASGAEGGADRRIAAQGGDQTIAARDVAPPRGDAA